MVINMNILFLTMNNFDSIYEHSVYPDLIRAFAKKENKVTVLLPIEKKYGKQTDCENFGDIKVIKVRTGNLFDVGMKTKLISRAGLCGKYEKALKVYAKGEKYELILSSTPPTILYPLINKIKKRDGAYSYLMLKDIFPQNAVDLGMISDGGIIHRFLRIFEKKLYASSDTIGCMSPANVRYLLEQDSWIDVQKVTLCPNAHEVLPKREIDRDGIRDKYGISKGKIIFAYGGGIGRPQGIDFFEECIRKIDHSDKYMFVVMGLGSYADRLKELSEQHKDLLMVIPWLPIDDFNDVVASSDVGLILLDHRFRIPNFPSRLLAYLQAGIPVFSSTDENCDVGCISEENGFGYWCISNDVDGFIRMLDKFDDEKKRRKMGINARRFFEDNYDVDLVAESIIECVTGERREKI